MAATNDPIDIKEDPPKSLIPDSCFLSKEIASIDKQSQDPNPEGGVLQVDVSLSLGNQEGAVEIGTRELEVDLSLGDGGKKEIEVLERVNTGTGENGAGSDPNRDFEPVDGNLKEEGFATVGMDSVVEDTELKASGESVVAEAEVEEEGVPSLRREDQNLGADVSTMCASAEGENRVVDAQVEKKDCDSSDGNRTIGGSVMRSDVSVTDEPGEMQIAGSRACEVGASVVGGNMEIEVLDRDTENNELDVPLPDRKQGLPDEEHGMDLKPIVDGSLNKGGLETVNVDSVVEVTGLKASDECVVIEAEIVETHASLRCEEQNTDADVSKTCTSVEEIRVIGAQVQKNYCDSLNEIQTLGDNVMESVISLPDKPGGKQILGVHVCEGGVSVVCGKPVTGGQVEDLDSSHGSDGKSIGGTGVSDVGVTVLRQKSVMDSGDVDLVASLGVNAKEVAGTDGPEIGVSVLGESPMGSQVRDLGTSFNENGGNILGSDVPEVWISRVSENQTASSPAVGMDTSLDTNKGKIVETCASEVGVSELGGSSMMGSQVVDLVTAFSNDRENIVGSQVPEVVVSLLRESRMTSSAAVVTDASLDTPEEEILETCASEVGSSVLSVSSPAVELSASVGVDEKKIDRSDFSEMGFSQVCENQMAGNSAVNLDTSLGTNETKVVGTNIPEEGVSLLCDLQTMGSSAEQLETHHGTDGKQLAGTGISLLRGNQMTGCLVVDLSASLAPGENLDTEVEATKADTSQPGDFHINGSKDNEMETHGELSLIDENTENEPEADNDGTLETEDDGAIELPINAEKQNRKHAGPGTASIKEEYRASYSLPQEKKGEFYVSDLVWGKVRSHPWWPGQIFDPSDSSELATKYKKKDGILVAYYGDRTFAWNEVSQLKPFRTHFPPMERQSTSEAFLNAVNCALDEVSRRVEVGLICSCVPEEICSKVKYQRIENAGIREGAITAGGADLSLFESGRLLEYVKELALFPLGGGERIELVIAKAQLMAFYRSKGYLELPAFNVLGGLVENDADRLSGGKSFKDTVELANPVSIDEDKAPPNLDSGEKKVEGQDRSSRKSIPISEDGSHHKRKQKFLAELMSGKKASNLVNGGKRSTDGKTTGNSGSQSSGKKRKAIDSFSDDSVRTRKKGRSALSDADPKSPSECKAIDSLSDDSVQTRKKGRPSLIDADPEAPSAKRSFMVGDCIRRIAGQLTGSPPILKLSGERFHNNAVKVDVNSERGKAVHANETRKRRTGIPKEYSSPDEMLSQLCLAARDPMKGYSFLSVIVSFFTDFRNSIHQRHSGSAKKTGSGKSGGKSSKSKIGSVELFESNEMKDSYWTDRVIHDSTEEEPSHKSRKRKGESKLESPKKKGRPASKQSNSPQSSPELDSDKKPQVGDINISVNHELLVGKQEGNEDVNGEEECSLTALILSFTEADSVPSEMDLSKIFSQYGPLEESEVLRKSNRARVVFKRRSDAEVAFSSAGKFSIFGPALVSYRLKYLSSKSKDPGHARIQGKKDATSMEEDNSIPPMQGGQTKDGFEI